MANPILKRTSFGLLRTNPKLTTNIKLIVDSKNKIFLESIDANQELAKSMYKGFEVNPYGSYSYDLKRFYHRNQEILSEDSAYFLFEEDPGLDIKKEYNQQYDFTYAYGFTTKDSKYYSEEYSLFAPIWLERDNIPDYFVIFKLDGPSTVNIKNPDIVNSLGSTANYDTDPYLDSLVSDPSNFNTNFIKKSKIVKTFDLSERSAIGKYIKNHVEDSLFPESSLFVAFEPNQNSYWNGISYRNGGFCSIGKDIYKEYTILDRTILQSDDIITNGFKTNSVVCANILNLEFLFDDVDQTKYNFSRYFGLYMSEVELGKFIIDNKRLSEDCQFEPTQSPQPFVEDTGNCFNETSQFQTNPNGIKIYPKIGPSGPFNGRLLKWEEIQNPRFSYIKDTKGNFYSINNEKNWSTTTTNSLGTVIIDTNFLRIKNTGVDWKNFSGMEIPFNQIPVKTTESLGRSSFSFKVLFNPSLNDEIRIKYTNWNSDEEKPYIDQFTLVVDGDLAPGKSSQRYFSNNGTNRQIAYSISNAINNLSYFTDDYQIFTSISIDDEVFVFTRTSSENWNELKFSIFSDSTDFPYDITSDEFSLSNVKYINNYIYAPIAELSIDKGWYYESFFTGGNTNPKSRLIINKDYIQDFRDPVEDVFVKTTNGYKRINQSLYLDRYEESNGNITTFNNTNKYTIIEIEDQKGEFIFSYDSTIALYKLAKNTNGYLSIFPVKEFDFDYHSTEYNRPIDTNPEKLYQWYQGIGTTFGSPIFDWNILTDTSKKLITNILGPTSTYGNVNNFQSLIGYEDPITDNIEIAVNEYDRLKENSVNVLSVSSRTVPFINKWIYDNNSVDVRENPYRLNTNTAFGFTNFSPAFDQILKSPKFFTHEWYYLQKYPPYMTFEEKLNSYSYFDEDLRFPTMPKYPNPEADRFKSGNGDELFITETDYVLNQMSILTSATGPSANLYSIKEDYFLSYFTRETIGGSAIPRDFKYSIFEGGNNKKPAETLFRGVKVQILDRFENSSLNNNKESLKYVYNTKYNGYRFSTVLTYGSAGTKLTIVKNDKWKSITLVIQADLEDALTRYIVGSTNNKFIDRSLLYTLEDKYTFSVNKFIYSNRSLSGRVNDWRVQSNPIQGTFWRVYFGSDNQGNRPKVNVELRQNEFGSYNDVQLTDGVNTYTFKKIFDVDSTTFKCREITGTGTIITPDRKAELSYLRYNFGSPWLGIVSIKIKPLNNNPQQLFGGFDAYDDIIESISFSSIFNDINNGDPDVDYVNIDEDGLVEYNKFTIDLAIPDYPMVTQYLKRIPVTNSKYSNTKNVIAYEIGADTRVKLQPMARYRGNYNPKTRDVIKFIDTTDLKNEGLSYYNIQILTDLGYIKDNNIGIIQNMYYNKVNTESQKILKSNDTKNRPFEVYDIYADIGEINIGKKNHFIFRSNWDPHYYNKFSDKNNAEPVMGTREAKEEKAFFASKTLSIPDAINIQMFGGIGTLSELKASGSIESLNKFYSDIKKTLIFEQVNTGGSIQLNIDAYIEDELIRWLINDGFYTNFSTNINNKYSFGNSGALDDAVQYIKTNILKRYEIVGITLWEKNVKLAKGEISSAQIVTNLADADKFNQGYKKTTNFRIKKGSKTDLNFKLIYNLQAQTKTSISISVELQKK